MYICRFFYVYIGLLYIYIYIYLQTLHIYIYIYIYISCLLLQDYYLSIYPFQLGMERNFSSLLFEKVLIVRFMFYLLMYLEFFLRTYPSFISNTLFQLTLSVA